MINAVKFVQISHSYQYVNFKYIHWQLQILHTHAPLQPNICDCASVKLLEVPLYSIKYPMGTIESQNSGRRRPPEEIQKNI